MANLKLKPPLFTPALLIKAQDSHPTSKFKASFQMLEGKSPEVLVAFLQDESKGFGTLQVGRSNVTVLKGIMVNIQSRIDAGLIPDTTVVDTVWIQCQILVLGQCTVSRGTMA